MAFGIVVVTAGKGGAVAGTGLDVVTGTEGGEICSAPSEADSSTSHFLIALSYAVTSLPAFARNSLPASRAFLAVSYSPNSKHAKPFRRYAGSIVGAKCITWLQSCNACVYFFSLMYEAALQDSADAKSGNSCSAFV